MDAYVLMFESGHCKKDKIKGDNFSGSETCEEQVWKPHFLQLILKMETEAAEVAVCKGVN